jgi:hypothetical protein
MAPKSFRRGHYRNKDQNPEKFSRVRFPVKMVSVCPKVSTTEERRQDKSCLFRRGDYSNKRNTENWPRFESSSKTKHQRRTAPRQKLVVLERRLQELRSQTRKLSWVRVPVNILGLGIIILKYSMIRDPRDDIRHDTYEPTTTAPTTGVATPTQHAIFCADESRNVTRHDADKMTPSLATPIFATATKDSIYV